MPTNQPMVRMDYADVIYKNEAAKYRAVVKEIREMHESGRPVLVGTISIDVSEKIHHMLKKEKIEHEVLNAKQHEREAEIIAQAGQARQGDHRHQHGWSRYRYQARRQVWWRPAVCIFSAPPGMNLDVSTISCGAVPGVRATRALRVSSSPSKMICCGSSAPTRSPASWTSGHGGRRTH